MAPVLTFTASNRVTEAQPRFVRLLVSALGCPEYHGEGDQGAAETTLAAWIYRSGETATARTETRNR